MGLQIFFVFQASYKKCNKKSAFTLKHLDPKAWQPRWDTQRPKLIIRSGDFLHRHVLVGSVGSLALVLTGSRARNSVYPAKPGEGAAMAAKPGEHGLVEDEFDVLVPGEAHWPLSRPGKEKIRRITAKAMDDEPVRPGCKSLFNSMATKAD